MPLESLSARRAGQTGVPANPPTGGSWSGGHAGRCAGAAGFQLAQQDALFFDRKRLPGLYCRALAHPRDELGLDLSLQRGFVFLKILHHHPHSRLGISSRQQGRDGAHAEGVRTKWLDLKPKLTQDFQLRLEKLRAGRRQMDRGRLEQRLRGNLARCAGA